MKFDLSNNHHHHPAYDRAAFEWSPGLRPNLGGGRRGHRHGHGGFGRHERSGFGHGESEGLQYDVLATLADGPRRGDEILRAIEEHRGFGPHPGAIYPVLQMLEDGDFVSAAQVDGKRIYSISEAGRERLNARPAASREAGDFDASGLQLGLRGLRAVGGLRDAAKALARSGDTELLARGIEILERARRELYTLLAKDETPTAAAPQQ